MPRAPAPPPPPPPGPDLSSRVSTKCAGVAPGHLTIPYPKSDFYPMNPPSYNCGFSKDGRVIGSNLPVPYPRELPWYHDIPFRRMVDWFAPAVIGEGEQQTWDHIRRKEKTRPGGHVDGCEYCGLEDTSAQTRTKGGAKQQGRGGPCGAGNCSSKSDSAAGSSQIEGDDKGNAEEEEEEEEDQDGRPTVLTSCCASPYPTSYMVQDDDAYRAWVDGKVDAQRARDRAEVEVRKVPWEIKLLPGHLAPSILETSNEACGQHLDMLPKPPLRYPQVEFTYKPAPLTVRYWRSNISEHPPIPDHGFAIPHGEMETLDGRPLRGMLGAVFTPDQGGPGAAADETPGKQNNGKIPTKSSCGGVGQLHKTRLAGPGVPPPAPGMPAPDPWTFRRSAVVLGRVVGERGRGATWPMYSPTGLELNRPVPRRVVMSAGYRQSDIPPKKIQVPVDTPHGVYPSDPSQQQHQLQATAARRRECQPQRPDFCGFSQQDPCHRDFFNRERLPTPAGWGIERQCKPGADTARSI